MYIDIVYDAHNVIQVFHKYGLKLFGVGFVKENLRKYDIINNDVYVF